MNQGTNWSPDESCEQSYLRGKSPDCNTLAHRKGENFDNNFYWTYTQEKLVSLI